MTGGGDNNARVQTQAPDRKEGESLCRLLAGLAPPAEPEDQPSMRPVLWTPWSSPITLPSSGSAVVGGSTRSSQSTSVPAQSLPKAVRPVAGVAIRARF